MLVRPIMIKLSIHEKLLWKTTFKAKTWLKRHEQMCLIYLSTFKRLGSFMAQLNTMQNVLGFCDPVTSNLRTNGRSELQKHLSCFKAHFRVNQIITRKLVRNVPWQLKNWCARKEQSLLSLISLRNLIRSRAVPHQILWSKKRDNFLELVITALWVEISAQPFYV